MTSTITEKFITSAKEIARARANKRCAHGMLESAKCVITTCEFWDGKKITDHSSELTRGLSSGRKGGKHGA